MSPARVCKAEVKDEKTLEVKTCGKTLSNYDGVYRCPDRDEHILKYKTGFCANGDCEGTANKTRNGNPKPSCKWWKRCPCACHRTFDMMFSMSEMDRQVVDNSGYAPDPDLFKMPTMEERIAAIAASMAYAPTAPVIVESPAPDIVPATIARTFTPTKSGRAARGELAQWVKHECDVWAVDQPGFNCTPAYLAEAIAKTQGFGKPPSVGAIDAVFKRWERIGFAEIGRKPTRFIRYTEQGVKLGLEGCIEKSRRTKKSLVSEAGRSFRR